MDIKRKRKLSREDLERLINSEEWEKLHDTTIESMGEEDTPLNEGKTEFNLDVPVGAIHTSII